MSYAQGRAFRALGEGLRNIGAAISDRSEREIARQRLALEQGRADAEYLNRTGVALVPGQAPRITAPAVTSNPFTVENFAGPPRELSGVAAPAPGYLGGPERPAAPVTPSRLAMAPVPPSRAPLTVRPTFSEGLRPGGFEQVAPSAEARASLEGASRFGAIGRAVAGLEPGVAAMTPQQQTLVGAGDIPSTVIDRAAGRVDLRTAAEGYRRSLGVGTARGQITPGVSDDEAVRQGRFIMQQRNDLRPGGAGGGGPLHGVPGARVALPTVERQVDDTRADLARAEREMPTRPHAPTGRPITLNPADEARFVADSSAAAGRIAPLQARADSLGAVRDSLAAVVQGRAPAPTRRIITTDQRDYLMSRGQWDPARYEVR